MIPILYAGNEQNFLNNGLGRLSDAINCKVTEERNGIFELEMTYPITGIHYKDIALNRIILAKTEEAGSNQAFIIYSITRPLNGIVTIKANHISYLLNGFVVMPFDASSLADAMSKINQYSVVETPFTFNTDVSSSVHFSFDTPRSIRSLLGGEQGSLLDTYGGYDYRFNNFQVSLLADRGNDNGVVLRYGKNLAELKNLDNTTNVYTGIVPYWKNDTTEVYLPEKVVLSEHASDYPYKIIKTVDFSQEFENAPSEAQLRAKAVSYLANNKGWALKNNIDVSFVALWQSEEYKDIAALERVRMCDTVRVVYSKLGVDIKTRVIKTVYNVLLERYDSISLGDATYNLTQAIQDAIMEPEIQKAQSFTKDAVARATKLIQGGLGGHVVFNTDGNGEPQEILIMDTDDIETAVNVIRMNLNGIGFSHNGYSGPFETAWTIDGSFVANFITAGEFNGALIKADTISTSALTAEAKEELVSTHDYINPDISGNTWEYGAVAPYLETIAGKTYLVLDGTGINEFNLQYYIRTATDAVGNVNFNAKFKYHVDRRVTLSDRQRFPFVYYVNSGGESRVTWKWLPAQTIEANTDYEWDTNFLINDIDTNAGPVKFGLYFIPGAKLYLEELEVSSTLDKYTEAGMDFTSKGLSVVVQEVERGGTHSYLPYDAATNTSRWKIINPEGSTGTPTISRETITVDGQTVDAIVLDGRTVPSNYETGTIAYLETDAIGQPTITLSYGYRSDVTIAPATSTKLCVFNGKTSGGGDIQMFYREVVNPNVISAGVDYSDNATHTPSLSIDPFVSKGQLQFQFHSGCKFYIYNLSMESSGDSYKKASLSYTTDGLNSTVQAGSIISTINQSAEAVEISASKINLQGDLSLRGDFKSFLAGDVSTYAFLDSGNLSFYKSGVNVFTIAASALLGNYAGIFFGDKEDPSSMAGYTNITQQAVTTPEVYVKTDSRYSSGLSSYDCVIEGDMIATETRFETLKVNPWYWGSTHAFRPESSITGDVIFYDHNNNCSVQFYSTVLNNSGGTVFVSDKRKKKNIKDLAIDAARSFIMALKPRKFKFKKELSGSDRFHHGFIAQEVKEAMDEDWGLYIEDQEKDFIGLRYDELMADMIAVIQDQEKRIQKLEKEIRSMKGEEE